MFETKDRTFGEMDYMVSVSSSQLRTQLIKSNSSKTVFPHESLLITESTRMRFSSLMRALRLRMRRNEFGAGTSTVGRIMRQRLVILNS